MAAHGALGPPAATGVNMTFRDAYDRRKRHRH